MTTATRGGERGHLPAAVPVNGLFAFTSLVIGLTLWDHGSAFVMSIWRTVKRWSGGTLVSRFAILSFVVIGATTAALSIVISSSLQKDMLAREWYVTANFVRLEAVEVLTPGDFAAPRTLGAQERFRRFYEQVLGMPEIVRVKIYDGDGVVVWSDEPRLIGQRFHDNPQLSRALRGETIANLESGSEKGENVFEESPRLVELYVPLQFPGVPGITGIAETYKSPEEVFANIASARRIVAGTALAGGALLWASLFGIVRAASRRMVGQHHALERRSAELTATNQELRTVQAQLVAAGRMAAIGEVVAAIAHGIRNPLANIRASAQVGLLECRDARKAACPGCPAGDNVTVNLGNVISEVDRLDSRVGELLRFVRPVERRRDRLDLNDVIRDALELATGRFARTRVKLVDRLAPSLPLMAGDRMLLEQALGAIVDNAFDAMSEEGMLTVTTGTMSERSGPVRIFVEIEDTGQGIRPQELAKIFELFYTTKSQGTGLGLALAKKFIEAYGGTLSVSSEAGQGALFRATFPVAD